MTFRKELRGTEFYRETNSKFSMIISRYLSDHSQDCTPLLGLLESKFPLLEVSTVVCYGIGKIGSCHIAQHQFGLLMELLSPYQPIQIFVYDPVLQEEEKATIRECGCQIIARNEVGTFILAKWEHSYPVPNDIHTPPQQCKFRVDDRTMFYMPHCGKAMYNNLLWANWSSEHLSKIAIVGNSFNSYFEKYVCKVVSYCIFIMSIFY